MISEKVGLSLLWRWARDSVLTTGCKEAKFADRQAQEEKFCSLSHSDPLTQLCKGRMFRSVMTMRRRPRGYLRPNQSPVIG